MSMESVAWDVMYKSSHTPTTTRRDGRTGAPTRRIGGFARPTGGGSSCSGAVGADGRPYRGHAAAGGTRHRPDHRRRFVGGRRDRRTGRGNRADRRSRAVTGIGARWLSANIGEGLILDLRRAVFDHVQRMPVAFFTRTRTGALVSRLNNDVIGAQRRSATPFRGGFQLRDPRPDTRGDAGDQLADHPADADPAAGVRAARPTDGPAHAGLARESAEYNARMSTQMTERFSAPGATLVKLFGRPDRESAEFADRADAVRDIGIRQAMLQTYFFSALMLVSALALALVYGLGGWLAVHHHLSAGAVVSLALLLTGCTHR